MIDNVIMNNSPIRSIKGRVELYNGSTLTNNFSYMDRLASFSVERTGENSKFFGFGICQKLTVEITDKNREINIENGQKIRVYLSSGEDDTSPFPDFFVTDVKRNENTNNLTITAYDVLYKANTIKFELTDDFFEDGEIETTELTLLHYASCCAINLGLDWKRIWIGGVLIPLPPINISGIPDGENCFELKCGTAANLEGTETVKMILDAIAEATQSIYYIDKINCVMFKRLDRDGDAVLTIDRANYFTLDSKTNKELTTICHTTDLGETIEATLGYNGSTQYIRNNLFWDLRDDVGALVENALSAIGGIAINQFTCSWRGNYCLELGDKIEMITKDGGSVFSYLLNDKLEYNGGLKQTTQWQHEADEKETATNPSTLGEALKQTFAKVDKANKEITMLASDVSSNKENISQLNISTQGITATVEKLAEETTGALENVNGELSTIKTSVEAKMSDEDVTLKINQALSNGVSKVETSTGFTFNENGLTVDKSNSEMKTTITEDGMQVYKNDEAVLTANNQGVDAQNLHATTYLIIGQNSRFEDYGSRTACFWIGG